MSALTICILASGLSPHSARALRKLHSNHSVVLFTDYTVNLLAFPGAIFQPTSPDELISSLVFVPFARRLGSVPGILVDRIKYGSFKVAWDVCYMPLPHVQPVADIWYHRNMTSFCMLLTYVLEVHFAVTPSN